MHNWFDQFAGVLRDKGLAIDGKALGCSFERAAKRRPLPAITAFATETRLVVRQVSVWPDRKSRPTTVAAARNHSAETTVHGLT